MVSCYKLIGVRSFILEVRSWSGNAAPLNLYQRNGILCLDRKGQRPKAQLSLFKVPVLAKRRQISIGSSFTASFPYPAQLLPLRESGTKSTSPQSPQVTQKAGARFHKLPPGRWPLPLGHKNRDGGRDSPLPQSRPRASGGP